MSTLVLNTVTMIRNNDDTWTLIVIGEGGFVYQPPDRFDDIPSASEHLFACLFQQKVEDEREAEQRGQELADDLKVDRESSQSTAAKPRRQRQQPRPKRREK